MKALSFLCILFIATGPVIAQVEFVTDNYFPADMEFRELSDVVSENNFSDPSKLADIENGDLISAVGFKEYKERIYKIGDTGSLSIKILTLTDYRAAYSLLSVPYRYNLETGVLGDASSTERGAITFCHDRYWVSVRSHDVDSDLLRRIASSVDNRMGASERKLPSIISYLPQNGLRLDTLEYFPGSRSFATYHRDPNHAIVQEGYEMEIVRADYSIENHMGTLTLMKFPTAEMGESYFTDILSRSMRETAAGMYFRASGPMLSILEGSFTSQDAREILKTINYRYSVQWIRDNKSQYTVVWGIPVHILNTTVWSFFFVLTLCGLSIIAGGAIAGFRLLLRRFIPQNPLDDPRRTEITRLKLQ
ncbi:MAG: hypothetical protein P8Z37_06085 [Acidobacteriota bacterium]